MTRIQRNIVVHAPLPAVVEFLMAEHQHKLSFYEGIRDWKPVTPGVLRKGWQAFFRVDLIGRENLVQVQIDSFAENQGWTSRSVRGMHFRTEWKFSTGQGVTLIDHAVEYRLPYPLIGGLIDALFVKGKWTGFVERGLENLRERVESEGKKE